MPMKRLYCDACEDVTWCKPGEFYINTQIVFKYICNDCGGEVNLYKATRKKAKIRKQKREEKAKKYGTHREKKKIREEDIEYVRLIQRLRCCIPMCNKGPIHAHHSDHKSQLGSDYSCIPLCNHHHDEYHRHLGSKNMANETWGIDIDQIVKRLNSTWRR